MIYAILAAVTFTAGCALGLAALLIDHKPREIPGAIAARADGWLATTRLALWCASVIAVALAAALASNCSRAGLASLRDLALSLRVLRQQDTRQSVTALQLRAVRHDEF